MGKREERYKEAAELNFQLPELSASFQIKGILVIFKKRFRNLKLSSSEIVLEAERTRGIWSGAGLKCIRYARPKPSPDLFSNIPNFLWRRRRF